MILPSAGITDVHHHAYLMGIFFNFLVMMTKLSLVYAKHVVQYEVSCDIRNKHSFFFPVPGIDLFKPLEFPAKCERSIFVIHNNSLLTILEFVVVRRLLEEKA